MRIQVHYPHEARTGVPRDVSSAVVRAVAAQVRAQLPIDDGVLALDVDLLAGAARSFDVNGRVLEVTWHLADELHDANGRPAFGACQVEPDRPGTVCVLINRRASTDRPDLAVSTAAHELGHVIFDVPSMIEEPGRRYHNLVARAGMLDGATYEAEQRANDFMGALLVPPVRVHTRPLAHLPAVVGSVPAGDGSEANVESINLEKTEERPAAAIARLERRQRQSLWKHPTTGVLPIVFCDLVRT